MKKYYKVKLTILSESVENSNTLDCINEDIIVEKYHGAFREIMTNHIFDMIWLEKLSPDMNYSDDNNFDRDFIPLTSMDLINYYNNDGIGIESDYHFLYHNYYAIDDIFNDIDDKGYYVMIDPIYFNRQNKKASKEEVRNYLSHNNKLFLNYLTDDRMINNKKKILK